MNDQPTVRFYVIGGFLGSGKTTAIVRLAQWFTQRGHRVAAITNDQLGELVDTATIHVHGIEVREILGACICSRFHDFVKAADSLLTEFYPTVLLAEPIGSCSELQHTVIEPLRRYTGERYHTMPLSVLIDPQRYREFAARKWSPSIRYLFEHQFVEADVLVFSKSDLYTDREFTNEAIRTIQNEYQRLRGYPPACSFISSFNGTGFDEWIETLDTLPTRTSAPVENSDSFVYSKAEEELGWVNLNVSLQPLPDRSPQSMDIIALLHALILRIKDYLHTNPIAHFKVLAQHLGQTLRAGLTYNEDRVSIESIESKLTCQSGTHSELLINLRAAGDPEGLYNHIHSALRDACSLQGIAFTVEKRHIVRPQRLNTIVNIGAPLDVQPE